MEYWGTGVMDLKKTKELFKSYEPLLRYSNTPWPRPLAQTWL